MYGARWDSRRMERERTSREGEREWFLLACRGDYLYRKNALKVIQTNGTVFETILHWARNWTNKKYFVRLKDTLDVKMFQTHKKHDKLIISGHFALNVINQMIWLEMNDVLNNGDWINDRWAIMKYSCDAHKVRVDFKRRIKKEHPKIGMDR